jgi:hypothetical protein
MRVVAVWDGDGDARCGSVGWGWGYNRAGLLFQKERTEVFV